MNHRSRQLSSRASILALVIGLWCLLIAGMAVGADKIGTPRQMAVGGSILLSRPTSSDLLRLPACSPNDTTEWGLDLGYNRRYELSDLDEFFVAGHYRWRKLTVAVGASQFGNTDLYAEQTLSGSLGYSWRWLKGGLTLTGTQIQFGYDYGTFRWATFGFSVSAHRGRFVAAVMADNLNRPRPYEGALPRERVYEAFLEYTQPESFSVLARVRTEEDFENRYSLGQMIKLSRTTEIYWGIITEPFEYGAGLQIKIPGGRAIYAASIHPTLGFTHSFSLSFGPQRAVTPRTSEF